MTVVTRRWFGAAALAAALAAGGAAAQSRPGNPNEYYVTPSPNVQDKPDIWVLDFAFKSPRPLTVEVPGRGRKTVWYMWYQVVNKTGQPRTFIPDFKLLTSRDTVHDDQVLPSVQDAIRRIEDATGRSNILNSVTISTNPVPASKPDANPKAVTGVAVWPDVVEKAADLTHFSVFVSGLSNGWSIDDSGVVRRKTLQLNFRRPSDGGRTDINDIRWVEPAQWRYLAADADFKGSLPLPKTVTKPGGGSAP